MKWSLLFQYSLIWAVRGMYIGLFFSSFVTINHRKLVLSVDFLCHHHHLFRIQKIETKWCTFPTIFAQKLLISNFNEKFRLVYIFLLVRWLGWYVFLCESKIRNTIWLKPEAIKYSAEFIMDSENTVAEIIYENFHTE